MCVLALGHVEHADVSAHRLPAAPQVWDCMSGLSVLLTTEHHTAVNDIAWQPGVGLVLALACEDGTVQVWDVPTGMEAQRFGKAGFMEGARKAVAWTHDGTTLASFAPKATSATDVIFNLVSSARLYQLAGIECGARFRQAVYDGFAMVRALHAPPAQAPSGSLPGGQADWLPAAVRKLAVTAGAPANANPLDAFVDAEQANGVASAASDSGKNAAALRREKQEQLTSFQVCADTCSCSLFD